jgi:hypothetical protein
MIKFGFFGIGLALVLWAVNYVLSTFDVVNGANEKEVS